MLGNQDSDGRNEMGGGKHVEVKKIEKKRKKIIRSPPTRKKATASLQKRKKIRPHRHLRKCAPGRTGGREEDLLRKRGKNASLPENVRGQKKRKETAVSRKAIPSL